MRKGPESNVYTTSSGHQQCLPWSLAAQPGTTEDAHSSCSHCDPPAVLTKPHMLWTLAAASAEET